jgi:hypothetical protein
MNPRHAAEQLTLLGQVHHNETLRNAANELGTALMAYVKQADTIQQETMPQFRQRELAKAKATVTGQLDAFRRRVDVETRRSQPTIPQPPLSKGEMQEVRSIVLNELLIPGKKVVDAVKLAPYVINKDAAVLHSLLHSPIDVLTPDDR